MCDQGISLDEVLHCINKLKDNKSPRNDVFFIAFDTIDHNFMLEDLHFLGFGEYF